jgi:hypothetical protein
MLHPCPACGFEVFDEPPGSYDVCPVCDWEDDEVQLRFPAMGGGANKESLSGFQQRILQRLPANVLFHEGYHRCSDWRPLTPKDCGESSRMPMTGQEYFDAIDAELPKYYWRTTGSP